MKIRIVVRGRTVTSEGYSLPPCICPEPGCRHCNPLPYCPLLIDYPATD